MNSILIDKAKAIRDQHRAGDLTSTQYFAKLASFGKKYNCGSVFAIEKAILKSETENIKDPVFT